MPAIRPNSRLKPKHLLHFDIDPSEIQKVKTADWFTCGIAADALSALIAYGTRQGFTNRDLWLAAELGELKKTYALNYDRDSALIQPYYVIETINAITKGEAIITTGVGQHQMWAAQYFDFREPRLWLTSGSMGTMGFGLPAAIGRNSHARPTRHRRRRRCERTNESRRTRDRDDL